ncbi:hypothetical protein KFK09_015418 [Dendrobium nobile]|uniref:Uncharacterized protein n=1 Tax=Dendrobium nobile TaxID=94219 RepID=A0A8T3BAH0_DENNO|nr:hypothetical protein KFK09_015418 [Dendrobium nobile]
MASEGSVADHSIDEHAEEEKVGDVSKCVDGEEIIFQPKEAADKDEAENSKEVGSTGMASTASFSEENLEPDDLSVSDITKKEEQHEKVGEVENSPQNSEVSNSSEPVVDIDEATLQSEADDAHEKPSEVQEKSSVFFETSAFQEPVISESKSEDLKDIESKPTFENERKSEEAPLVSTGVDISKDGNIVADTQEAANPAFSTDKTGIELIGSEDSNDEIHVLVPAEIPTVFVPDSSETPEKNVDSTNLASIEVPVKDLEAVSGSPEEQKSKESTEIQEPISNVSINDAGDEVVGSSSYEVKPTGVSEVVENKDGGLEAETSQPSFKIQEDLEANYKLAQTESDENVSQGVEVKKADEIVEGGIETSTVPDDVPPLAIVSSEEEKASEPGVVVEEGESSLESDNIDAVPKVAKISLEGGNVVEEELVDKEKIVTSDAVQRDLVDSVTEAKVSSDQVRTPITENVNEDLEVTSKELNIDPVASEAFSEGDQIPAGEEKSDSLEGEVATSVETTNDISTPEEEPLDQLIQEKKSESLVSETHSPSEDKLLDEEKDANKEAKDINLQSEDNGADQIPSVVQSDFAEKSASQEPAFSKSKIEDLKDIEIKPTTENERKPEEAHLISTDVGISEGGNVEAEAQDTTNLELSKDKVDIELIKLEHSKDEIQVPIEIPTVVVHDTYEAPEKNDIDSSRLTSIEIPVKNLEVEYGSPKEQKSNVSTETKEPSSDVGVLDAEGEVGVLDAEGEVVRSSFYEEKPSGVAEVIEKKNNGLEGEKNHSSVEIHKDLEAKSELAETQSDENVSEGVKIKKYDEIVEGGIEISTVPDDIPLPSEVSYKEEKASEPAVVFKKEEETSLEDDNIGTASEVAEVSLEGGNNLEGDKLVDKEEVNADAVERDLFNTIIDPAKAKLSSDQVKAHATTESENEALELTSKEVNVAPEASDVPSEVDKMSTGDEKSEGLKDETSTSMEAPNSIITVEEPLDQVIEENKSVSSINYAQPPSEDKLFDLEKDVNEEDKEINLQSRADGADQNLSVVQSDFAETSTSQEPVFLESKNEDLKDTETQPTSENERRLVEAPLACTGMDTSKDGNLEAKSQEAANSEFSKDKVGMELIKSEDSKDEIQVLVPHEIPTVVAPDAFEAPEKNDVDSTYPTSIEVPVKDLEVEFGSPEEQKPKESTETKEPSSSASTIDAGGEVVGSSYEAKTSGNAVVEREDDGLEIHENPEDNPELAQTQSDENVSEGVEAKKDDEIVEGAIETSNVPDDVPSLAKVSYEEEKAVEPGIVVEEDKTSLEGDYTGSVVDVSLKGANVLKGDKLVDKEKVVNSDDVETDLVGTFPDPTDAEVSSDQVKAPTTTEIVKEESNEGALKMTSKELNIAPESSEFPSEVDAFSAGNEEKSESLIVGDATSVEVPKDIIVIKESLDQLVEEKKSETLASEMAAQTEDKLVDEEKNVNLKNEERELINTSSDAPAAEVSSEKVKAPELVEEESNKQALEETAKELNIAPEASEVTYEDDKLFAGEEKSESLKGEAATSVEAPEDIITIKESRDQAIEEGKSEREAPAEDKLVDKEKKVNEKAEERDLVDTSIDPTAAEVSSDQTKAYETVDIMKEESNEQALEVTSQELNIASEATEVSLVGDEVSEGDEVKRESSKGEDATLVEAPKNIKIAEDTPDQVIIQKKSEGSKSLMEALAEDKLVDKEKDINAEAEKAESVDIPTDPSAAEVFSEQVKVKEAPELASKELNIVPEASEVPSEGDKVSLGEGEQSKSLKGEDAASLEAQKDITTQEKSVDQLIEENKSESSKNKIEAPIETTRDFDASLLLPKAVKDIIASEAVQEKQHETSNDLSLKEKKANDSEYKKEEVKVEEPLQHATDKPGQAELRTEKAASEKSKDETPIVSSDTVDAKLTKEVTKRESNIFSKVKRSIVKAKKAILGKSPGTKTLSSEAKDENI